jgi:type IX secretion system PorP/SprF family membrane protein
MPRYLTKLALITTIFVLRTAWLEAQDFYFSQFYFNLIALNPAYSGETGERAAVLTYRNQWPGSNAQYVTYNAGYDQPSQFLHGGIGFLVSRDEQGGGILNRHTIDAQYAYHLEVNREISLNAGFQAGLVQKSLNTTGLVLPDMLDPSTGNIIPGSEQVASQQKIFPDFSFGMVAGYKNFYGGIVLSHLTRPQESFSGRGVPLNRKLTVHAGGNINLEGRYGNDEGLFLSPNIIFQQQGSFKQLNYGFYLSKNSILAGFWVRQNLSPKLDALIFSTGVNIGNARLGYSYDLNIPGNGIKMKTYGAHEVTFRLQFQYNVKRKKYKAIKCPKI